MEIAAIIVTYNPDIDVLSKLVSTLCKQVNRIIIVDNNSKNATDIIYSETKVTLIKRILTSDWPKLKT